jgi:nicotinate-nucleotide adenylyltransferase
VTDTREGPLAIFGGSFDPPHVAHLLAASAVLATTDVERVLVAPAFEHAFGKRLAPFAERLELCRRCFEDLARVEVSALEAELPRPNYTVRLLERLRADHPGRPLRLVIGSDVLAETSAWFEYERVIALAPPLVLTRAGHERPGLGPPLLPEVSSTHVRELLARRDEPDAARELDWLVPRRVLEHIAAAGLYPR